jgi:hypothetical protein
MTAVMFQLMPPLSPDEYTALETSIITSGVQVPIVVDENGVVIDGHHRKRIAESFGLSLPTSVRSGLTNAEKRSLALSLNVDRRHLSREQRRELVAASLIADPQLADREHARRTGVSPSTVGTIRSELEDDGQVSKLDSRISADGRERPASQPPRPIVDPAPTPVSVEPPPVVDSEGARDDFNSELPIVDAVIEPDPIPQPKPQLTEAERIAKRDADERQAAIRRQHGWIMSFLLGWDCAATLHNSAWRDAVLAAMSDFDRDRFLRIESEYLINGN